MGQHLLGEPAQALASSEQALSHEATSATKRKRYFGYDQRTSGLAVRARVLWLTGQMHEAVQVSKQAIDEGAELKHPVSYCLTLLYATSVYLWSERWADAEESIERLADTSSNYSLEPYFAGGQALKGELLHARGDHSGAVPLLGEACERLNRERQIAQAPYCAAVLADALNSTARFDAALDVVDRAVEQRRSGGGSFELPEMLRIRSRALLGISANNRDAALESVRSALDLARKQGALSWALRAALAQAELQPEGSKAVIEELVARFPSDAASADLKVARTLLAS
jgi:hypothetical protein